MSILRNDYLHLLIRLIMGGLFIYAGLGKILTPLDFASSIYNYKLFPDFVVGLAAATVPWIEFLAGLCLVLGFKVRGGALAISTLLVVFICLLVISALRGLDVECGCFSGVERRVGWLAIAEDLAMLTGGLFVLFGDRLRLAPASFFTGLREFTRR
jgi:uncharacterized membrane protein YphA (DoxX/SURF4 family)